MGCITIIVIFLVVIGFVGSWLITVLQIKEKPQKQDSLYNSK